MATKKPTPSYKIGLVLDDGLDKPDGVQQYVYGVGEWLRAQGHEVHYLVGETGETDLQNVHSMSRNIHVRGNGNRMSVPLPTSRRKLKAFMDREQFDILHIQVPYSPFMGHRLIQVAGPRTAIVGTFHIAPNSGLVTVATKALGRWLRGSLKQFDAMLSVSTAAADFSLKTFKVPSQVVPNVFDYDLFHDGRRRPEYQAEDVKNILFFGRLVPRKGCLLLLQAVVLLKQKQAELPKFRVIVGGKGPLLPTLETFAKNNGIADLVEFVGFVAEADKPSYYASADISVFPSTGGESFGIVLLEAMASGKAVVLAGDNPGYRSVMDKQPELLFDPRSAEALAAKLHHYLVDQPSGDAMRAWGSDYTRDFDTDVVGHKLLAIYEQSLHKRRPS